MAHSNTVEELALAASPYLYPPLSENGSILLLRLQPHQDYHAPIECQIFEYPLRRLRQGPHLYEALSYVWGSEENKQPIYIEPGKTKSNGGSVAPPPKTTVACL